MGVVRSTRARRGSRHPLSTRRWPVFGRRAPGLRCRLLHDATHPSLVKNQYAILSSLSLACRVLLHDSGTAGPTGGRSLVGEQFPCITSAGASREEARRRRGMRWRPTAVLAIPGQPCRWVVSGGPRFRTLAAKAQCRETSVVGMCHRDGSPDSLRTKAQRPSSHSNRQSLDLGEPFSRLAHPAFGELGQPENGPR